MPPSERLYATAVVPAGGRGSRMGALTAHRQKCLIPVTGRPVLSYVIQAFAAYGCRQIYFLTGYLSSQVEKYVSRLDIDTFAAHCLDARAKGTAQALSRLQGWIHEPFFYSNADIIFDPKILSQLATAFSMDSVLAVMALSTRNLARTHPHALVRGEDVSALEFPARGVAPRYPLCSMELMIMSPVIFDFLPAVGEASMVGEALQVAIDKGHRIRALVTEDNWFHLCSARDLASPPSSRLLGKFEKLRRPSF